MTDLEDGQAIVTLLAGTDNKGQAILEKLPVVPGPEKNSLKLLRSPLLVRNLAAGDLFRLHDGDGGSFSLLQRGGMLCIRVFAPEGIDRLEWSLTPEVEKLDGSLDLKTPRALVYSLHVNIGFAAIETLFDNAMANFPGSVWYYGNVYDPRDGVTPLNWWGEFLGQI